MTRYERIVNILKIPLTWKKYKYVKRFKKQFQLLNSLRPGIFLKDSRKLGGQPTPIFSLSLT